MGRFRSRGDKAAFVARPARVEPSLRSETDTAPMPAPPIDAVASEPIDAQMLYRAIADGDSEDALALIATGADVHALPADDAHRSEEHTSELQSLMRT